MAKRYHSSREYERDVVHDGRKEGGAQTKEFMHKSGAMMSEDRSAPANLPRHIIDSYYPAAEYGMPGGIGNLFTGAQKQMAEDKRDLHKEFKPGKY